MMPKRKYYDVPYPNILLEIEKSTKEYMTTQFVRNKYFTEELKEHSVVLEAITKQLQHTYGWGRRLLLLDPARGKERLMEIQQHDGMVVEVAAISAGLRQAQREGEVLRGEREAPGDWVRSPPFPSLYSGPGGASAP